MGGCTNSKYADVDEGKQPKEKKKLLLLRGKKNKKENGEQINGVDGAANKDGVGVENGDTTKAEKEDIEFIDKEEAEKAAAAAAAGSSFSETKVTSEDDNTKKEVTTYQTTVVKHTQREGDELLQHLKDEAFRSLQNLLNEAQSAENKEQQEDIVKQIKEQVGQSVGKIYQDSINSIIDTGSNLIKENKVKTMNELSEQLEIAYPDIEVKQEEGSQEAPLKNSELVKKVINATTGFLTAKGTEAGALLSNILANVHSGIQGVMNETEKTTVKVTRTVTEQVMTNEGKIKEITRVITSDEPVNLNGTSNIEEVIKNLSTHSPSDILNQVTKTGTTTSTSNTVKSEKYETAEKSEETSKSEENDGITKQQAEQVVTKVVSAAVEKIIDETNQVSSSITNHVNHNGTNGYHHEEEHHHEQNGLTEEHIKIEEEKSITTSTTKIILNNSGSEANDLGNDNLEHVQQEFYKQGKEAAEEVVKKVTSTSESTTNEANSVSESATINTTATA
jgi:hypothetical protein